MKAVVMAGGEGTRLRPLTCTLAKPMLRILGKPVIEYIIDLLCENGINEIAVTLRYKSEDIEDYISSRNSDKIKITCIEEKDVLGTAGSVKNAANEWNEPFVVISGDCICDCDLKKIMLYHKSIMADTTVVCKAVEDPSEYGTVVLSRTGEIDSFCEKPDWSHTSSSLVNTGIYIINPAVLDLIPENKKYDFANDLFPDMMHSGKRLYGYNTTAYWCDIGDLSSYRKCVKDILMHKTNINIPDSKNGIFAPYGIPKGEYEILPPVYIGKNVRIENGSVIGPISIIEDNTVICRNTRIKKSIIFANSQIGSNCDLIGTVIGEKCILKDSNICLEGSCIGDGCLLEGSSTISNNVLIWPSKNIPYRSVLTDNLRDGLTEYSLIGTDGIRGKPFTELTTERCCKLGEAVASSSCGKSVGIGYDATYESKALAMAVLSGLMSGAEEICDFGECFEAQMNFYSSHCNLECYVYISSTEDSGRIKLLGKNGLPLLRKNEREIEKIFKKCDFKRNRKAKKICDMSMLGDIYYGSILSYAANKIKDVKALVCTKNSSIQDIISDLITFCGIKSSELPKFFIDDAGISVSAVDENGENVSYDKLIVLCAADTLASGLDIAIPFNSPVCIDSIADSKGRSVYRIGKSPMSAFGNETLDALNASLWAYDGIILVIKILMIMKKKKTGLNSLTAGLPSFAVCSKTVYSGMSPSSLANFLGISTDTETQGLRKKLSNGYFTIAGTPMGRRIRIIAESDSMETASEICNNIEKKINGDSY